MTRRTLFMASAIVLALASVTTVDAYLMLQISEQGWAEDENISEVSCWDPGGFAHWGTGTYQNIRWRLNPSGQGSGKAFAVQDAMDAWNNVTTTNHRLVYDGTTNANFMERDGQNTIAFALSDYCGWGCAALTGLYMGSNQVILESDIIFNADEYWRTDGGGNDTQAVLTHEFGHSLGIAHTQLDGSPPSRTPTMVWNVVSLGIRARTLEADDRAALNCSKSRYYPTPVMVTVHGPSSLDPGESGTWTCSVLGGTPPYSRSWFKATSSGMTNLGSGWTQSTSDTTTFNIVCDAWDSLGRVGTGHVSVDVDGPPDGPPLPR